MLKVVGKIMEFVYTKLVHIAHGLKTCLNSEKEAVKENQGLSTCVFFENMSLPMRFPAGKNLFKVKNKYTKT